MQPGLFHNASLIITSIAAPNAAMQAFAEGCKENGVDFIVIGDSKSPPDFQLNGCRFVSLSEQRSLPYRLARLLPEKHYARKNLGYLIAKNKSVIVETDDDNLPRENFWNKNFPQDSVNAIRQKGWINAYRFFSDAFIWPRGFPLEELQNKSTPSEAATMQSARPEAVRILQGLADENPDVDAIYRMTSTLPFVFEKKEGIILEEGSWCPFNSQNTAWKKDAFPLLYLPSYCSFRMTDIWRSFVAQRIAWTCGWSVMFHSADVWQERNEHSLLRDFEDEIPGYRHNAKICSALEKADLKKGPEHICENLKSCYRLLIQHGWIGPEEEALVDAWCEEF